MCVQEDQDLRIFNQAHTTSSTENSEGRKLPRSGSNQDDTTIPPTGTTASGSLHSPSTPDVPPTPSTPGVYLGAVIPPPRPTNILEETNDSGGLKFSALCLLMTSLAMTLYGWI